MEYPGDVRGHAGTQPVGEWRHMRGEGGKHQAMQDLDAQALQAMRGKVEVWRQAPLVANAVPKRHATQAAVQIKGPVMVGTGKLLRVSALGDTEEGAALGTAVDEHLHSALRVPDHDDRGIANALGFEIAWGRGFDLQSNPMPDITPENPLLLARIQCRIGKDLIGHPADAQRRLMERQFCGSSTRHDLHTSLSLVDSQPMARQYLSCLAKAMRGARVPT